MKLVIKKSANKTRHDNLKIHSLNFLKEYFYWQFYAPAEIPDIESFIINVYISKYVLNLIDSKMIDLISKTVNEI